MCGKIISKILFIIILFTPMYVVFGEENKISFCSFDEKYEKWLNLPEKERNETITPFTCKLESSRRKSFNLLKNSEGVSLFDLRNINEVSYVTAVRDQKSTNSCWAFSSLGALESHLLISKDLTYDFSERHMQYSSTRNFLNGVINEDGFNSSINSGGNMYFAMSYFNNGKGPILEGLMPFEDNEDLIDISGIQNKSVSVDVNNIKRITGEEGSCSSNSIYAIKDHIMGYGGVEAGIHFLYSENEYYNNNSFFYNGIGYLNHAVVIVGWDDNYSKDNFNVSHRPLNNGAWIAKNSYGTSFGDNGYMYISYEDIYVCSDTFGYLDVDLNVEDNSYYYDSLGYNVGLRYADLDYSYVGNKFTKKTVGKELLTEVQIGLIGPTSYELYVNSIDDNLYSQNLQLVKTGSFNYSGYGTIKLDNPIILENNTFAVVVKFTGIGIGAPIPVQTKRTDTELYDYQQAVVGKSFVTDSFDQPWVDLSTLYGSGGGVTFVEPIASIKAYTNDLDKEISSEIYTFESNYIENISNNTTYTSFISGLSIDPSYSTSLLDKSGNTITGDVIIGTNMSLLLDDGVNKIQYKTVVKGDVTGDGIINVSDVAKLYQHLKRTNVMSDISYIKASDVVYDSEIKINDVAKLYQYVKGIITGF